jgi:homogentisate 1,2-dioxygenase
MSYLPLKVSLAERAAGLDRPFAMNEVAQVDELALSVYRCEGTMPLHRHLDQDEAFLVHSGSISLESEWGSAVLRPGELSVVPKGLGHRSTSLVRSLVLLFQPRGMVNRRNGHRRVFVLPQQGRLEKVSVPAVGRQITMPFRPIALADLDVCTLTLTACRGAGLWQQNDAGASLVLCHTGHILVDVGSGEMDLNAWELTVIPSGMAYRLSSPGHALALGIERHEMMGEGPSPYPRA